MTVLRRRGERPRVAHVASCRELRSRRGSPRRPGDDHRSRVQAYWYSAVCLPGSNTTWYSAGAGKGRGFRGQQ